MFIAVFRKGSNAILMQANLTMGQRDVLDGTTMSIPIDYRKRHNARRYILRMNEWRDGGCVTIPRGGNLEEARKFAKRNLLWLEGQLKKLRDHVKAAGDQNSILYSGEKVSLEASQDGLVFMGEHTVRLASDNVDIRTQVEEKLWELARTELPPRVAELAARHGLRVNRVSVRNQRSRWGSCSARGVISLNWRLVQTPEYVRDYIIVHELMHLREMNHSHRFWKLVHEAFPQTQAAEQWLRLHAALLRN
jgi:predicted metal-dependent hydrolase